MVRNSASLAPVDPDVFGTLAPGETNGTLRHLFNGAGARPPLILWSPTDAEISNPLIHAFARRMRALAAEDGRVRADAVTPDTLGTLAGWTLLVDAEGPRGPFRYRHIGDKIVPYATQPDIVGRTSEDYGDFFGSFYTAVYRAAAARKDWVFSEHDPPREVFIRSWQRLIVPLFAPDGDTVSGFATACVPENTLRAGLDLLVDPVFILDGAQVIQHCNHAAEALISKADPHRTGTARLADVIGAPLEIGLTPAEVLARGERIELIELVPRGGIVERMALTVSATQHRGQAFYIVVMRQNGHG